MNWWMGKLWARVDITCHVITGNHLKNENLRKGVEEIKNTEMDIWQFTSKQQWHDKKTCLMKYFLGNQNQGIQMLLELAQRSRYPFFLQTAIK